MAIRISPLPLDVFPKAAQPSIARLNRELRDLSGLEGTIGDPRNTRRSDNTIARREAAQVAVSRITPDISSVVAGVSVVIGVPNLTLGQTNVIGTTNTTLSVNSSIALFGTATPTDSDAGAAVLGSSAFAAHGDHKHLVSTAVPSFTLGTSATIGTTISFVRSDATLPIFDTTVPAALETAAATGSVAFAARRDHVHEFPEILQSDENSATFKITDNGTDTTVQNSLGDLKIEPLANKNITLAGTADLDEQVIIGTDSTSGLAKLGIRLNSSTNNSKAMRFHMQVQNTSSANFSCIDGIFETNSTTGQGNLASMWAFNPILRVRGTNKTVNELFAVRTITQFTNGDASDTKVIKGGGLVVLTPTRQGEGTIDTHLGLQFEACPSWVTTPLGVDSRHPGIFENPSTHTADVLTLTQNQTDTSNSAHLLLNDKTADPAAPVAGQIWRNANDLKFRGSANIQVVVWEGETQTLTSKTLTTPTIADLSNMTHDHSNAAGGAQLNADTAFSAGTLAVDRGGTNLASGTNGGLLAFTATGTIASSVLLTANQLIIGGGAGATPTPLAAGTDNFVLRMGASNPGYEAELLSKDANITSPTNTEDASLFYTPIAITATEVRTVIRGTGGGLLLNHALFHSTDRSAAGNSLTVGQSYTGTTAGVVASLSDATIPGASYIWMQTAGSSGTVNEAHVHLRYTID